MTHAGGEGQTIGRTAYLAELQCFLCGSLAGSIEADRKPLPPYGVWHPMDGGRPQRVADWRSLRCPRCGGASATPPNLDSKQSFAEYGASAGGDSNIRGW